MTISDYNNNLENAINDYLDWAGTEWRQEDIDKIITLSKEKEADNGRTVA